MVLSELQPTIQYKEQKELYDDDVEMETKLYDIFFPSMRLKLTVAPGKQKHMMNNKGIVFFPIYLIFKNKFIRQIGVYELFADELPTILDTENENEIDLSLIKRDPLLYSFSTQEELKEYGVYADDIDDMEETEPDELDENIIKGVVGDAIGEGKIDDEKESDDESDDESDNDDKEPDIKTDTGKKRNYMSILGRKKYMSIFVDKIDHNPVPLLPEETSEDADGDKRVFKEKMTTTWIEKFMKNNNYSISKTSPDGNCFFYVIRDAFESIGKKTTVEKLRNIFSESIDEQTYMQYKEKYNMFKESYDQDTIEQKQLKEELSNSKKKYKITKDRKAQESLEKYIEEKTEILKNLTDGMESTKDILSEFEYMEKIDSLEQFKEFIKTPKCWADTVTVSTMEKILNIKLILLSQEAYENDDKDNVVLCGQINDEEITSKSIFEPSFYIIAQYSGDHYDLIGYKSKFMLQFNEIPYDLKKLILMKCLEKKSGPYNLIPEFKEMKSHYDSKIIKDNVKLQGESSIFDENVVFQIYHNSNDKPFPGKGAGEKLESDIPETRKKYAELSKIINWRRKLANTHVEPFLLKGKNWNSVEHYIQAQKFKSSPELYDQFTLESKSSISEDPIKARDAGTKKTYFKEKYKIDPGFSSKLSEYLTEALEAKFSNEELKTLLLATKDAKIVSFARANTPPVMTELMQVRKSLS